MQTSISTHENRTAFPLSTWIMSRQTFIFSLHAKNIQCLGNAFERELERNGNTFDGNLKNNIFNWTHFIRVFRTFSKKMKKKTDALVSDNINWNKKKNISIFSAPHPAIAEIFPSSLMLYLSGFHYFFLFKSWYWCFFCVVFLVFCIDQSRLLTVICSEKHVMPISALICLMISK